MRRLGVLSCIVCSATEMSMPPLMQLLEGGIIHVSARKMEYDLEHTGKREETQRRWGRCQTPRLGEPKNNPSTSALPSVISTSNILPLSVLPYKHKGNIDLRLTSPHRVGNPDAYRNRWFLRPSPWFSSSPLRCQRLAKTPPCSNNDRRVRISMLTLLADDIDGRAIAVYRPWVISIS